MSSSKDFVDVMKMKLKILEFGIWFTQPRTSNRGEFDRNKLTLYLKIDQSNSPKRMAMELYFNHPPRSLETIFFGTLIILTR